MTMSATQDARAAPSAEQGRAMDTAASAWVGANAGSGKTYVLTRRVLRLMLDGAHPSTVLGLTFTKTAAAQMGEKVFGVLAGWTMLDDQTLGQELETLTGRCADPRMLAHARTLFAKAVETPGRLKIQTIHAFCESLLHRFPVEAGVPVGFRVLDETITDQLLERAISGFFVSDAAAGHAQRIDLLTTRWSETDLRGEIRKAMAQRMSIDEWAKRGGSHAPDQALADLRRTLGLARGETRTTIANEILDNAPIAATQWTEAAAEMASLAKPISDGLTNAAALENTFDRALAYLKVFLKKEDLSAPKNNPVTARLRKSNPHLAERLENEWTRLEPLAQAFLNADIHETTEALLTITRHIGDRYAALKRRMGGLDYDDLIERTRALLHTAESVQWVMYKLDRGIRHVLVDEAQDTSPAQWAIIQALTEDFFAGDTAIQATRTAFAVGDPKQSIFSFQGARPAGFDQMRRTFKAAARDARKSFNEERLKISYRSAPEVLKAVDRVFGVDGNAEGLDPPENDVTHSAHRAGTRGFVDVWPLVPRPERQDPENWRDPLDKMPEDAPELVLSERIARFLRQSIDAGTKLPGSGKTLTAADVLILVRTRTGIAKPLIRELKQAGLDVAGADRLKLLDSIAVEDLLAAAQCALMPNDDHALACLLKSPLLGWDEDRLMALAIDRPGSLISALRTDESALARRTVDRLDGWRSSARVLRPHEFFAGILGPQGGRKAIAERLGPEAEDVLDAFMGLTLSYERDGTGSLAGFASWLRATDTEIKRDMEAVGRAVRVMTVHGAKGLEAPLVILADAGKAFAPGRVAQNLHIAPNDEDALAPPDHVVVMPRQKERTLLSNELRDTAIARQKEEWRRLLYVAMTRAEDWLVICGTETARSGGDTWYGLVADALDAHLTDAPKDGFAPDGTRRMKPPRETWRFDGKPTEHAGPATPADLPDWLSEPTTLDSLPQRKAVSKLGEGVAARGQFSVTRQSTDIPPSLLGTATHRMLELLPGVPAMERENHAADLATRLIPETYAAARNTLAEHVPGLLADPALAHLFGSDGLSEVPVIGDVQDRDGTVIAVTGRIDRLVLRQEGILIVDYKSDASVPVAPEDVPERYRDQLSAYAALIGTVYPERTVSTAILWTANARLMDVPKTLHARFSSAPMADGPFTV